MSQANKVILGIDPGTQILGYGLLRVDGKSMTYITMGVIDLRKLPDHFAKLSEIFKEVSLLISKYSPDEMAIEAPFFGKNVQSMLKLGRAQGAAIAAALNNNIPICEYAPRKIKLSITGKGAASKEQVASMISKILNIDEIPVKLDATDGLAVALCHSYSSNSVLNSVKSSKSWESFIKNNPDRVK